VSLRGGTAPRRLPPAARVPHYLPINCVNKQIEAGTTGRGKRLALTHATGAIHTDIDWTPEMARDLNGGHSFRGPTLNAVWNKEFLIVSDDDKNTVTSANLF